MLQRESRVSVLLRVMLASLALMLVVAGFVHMQFLGRVLSRHVGVGWASQIVIFGWPLVYARRLESWPVGQRGLIDSESTQDPRLWCVAVNAAVTLGLISGTACFSWHLLSRPRLDQFSLAEFFYAATTATIVLSLITCEHVMYSRLSIEAEFSGAFSNGPILELPVYFCTVILFSVAVSVWAVVRGMGILVSRMARHLRAHAGEVG